MKKVLVDSSVWISHFKKADPLLIQLLAEDSVVTHPFVLQELYLGRPKGKDFIFDLLETLETLPILETADVFSFIEKNNIVGGGIGIIDTHLLASAYNNKIGIHTNDKNLKKLTTKLL